MSYDQLASNIANEIEALRINRDDWKRIADSRGAELEALRTKHDTLIATYKADLVAWKTCSDALYTKHQELRTKYEGLNTQYQTHVGDLCDKLGALNTKYEALRTAAQNLADVKGRYHSEQAYTNLVQVLRDQA